jgi:ubiquinone biosynthesis protein
MKPRHTLRAIRLALGEEASSAFAWFDPQPLAAASIGQVHRARLQSGEQVVVKVQRPGVRETIAADLQLLRWMASLLSRAMPEIAALDPLSLIDAFERSLNGELDYRREAENAVRLHRLLDGAREVRVPRVYHEWTRRTLLVLEYVRGRRLADLDEESRRLARGNLLRAFTRQILDHGVFHADPHPGNVLVEDDGRVVLLDLGAVDAVEAPMRAGLARLVRAVALGRKRALCEAVLALSPNGSAVAIDRARLEADLHKLVDDAGGRGTGAQVLGQMVAVGRNHRLRMQPSLVALVRALALLDGVLRGLDPARDLVADLRREVVASFLRRVGRAVAKLSAPFAAVTAILRRCVPRRWLRRKLPPAGSFPQP